MQSPIKFTHMVVSFPANDSRSKEALLLGKIAPSMNTVCRTTNLADAETVRRVFQATDEGIDKDEEREYAVIELNVA